jgi:predicted HTH transcriptional regulator
LHGGTSDCRNRTLHQLFLLINLGERAGSGLPKIRAGWEAEGHLLQLSDSFEPFDQTRLEMRWAAHLPPDVADAGAHSSGEVTVETRVETRVQTTVKIMSMLEEDKTLSSNQLSAALGKSQSAIERALKKLREQGLIRHVGPNKGGHWEILK